MSPALEKQIADTLGAAQQTGSDALSFIKERAPILAEQIIQWHIAKNGVIASITGIIVIVCLMFALREVRKDDADSDIYGPNFAGAALAALLFLVGSVKILQAITAPDLVVLDYISDFVK